MTENPTKIGMIGLGAIAAKAYLPVLSARPDVEIVALASRSVETVERVGRQYKIANRYTAVEDVLQHELDVVFVHASTIAHYEIVKQCLRAGRHVFVDKPLTDDIVKTRELTELSTQQELLLAVGFNRRFAPLMQKAHAAVSAPEFVSIEKHRVTPPNVPASASIYDELIHLVDTLLWILGNEVEVTSYEQRTDSQGRLLTTLGTLVSCDATAQFSMHFNAGMDSERFAILGNGRSGQVFDLERLTLHRSDMKTHAPEAQLVGFASWDTVSTRRGFTDLIDHVLGSLKNPDECSVSAKRVLATHELIESFLVSKRA